MKLNHVLVLGLAACATAAGAQSLKPGLWEFSNTMHSASGQMEQAQAKAQQEMAKMPPEQRKMMEDMMAKQGVKMGQPGGATTLQVCMTKEMVERTEMPMQQQRGDCKTTQQSRSGNTMKMAYACSNPPSSGEGEYTFISNEAYKSKMMIKTTVNGKPETMNMEGSGKWLSADCGTIKPFTLPPAAKK